jgi:hypothetical protein
MTRLDTELAELSQRIRSMSDRAKAALFWACSDALSEEFSAWAEHTGAGTEPLLRRGQSAAYDFAAHGTRPAGASQLLSDLEAGTPPGESPDEVSSTSAQDCWICADVGVRVFVERDYDAGPAIEYALEPLLGRVSEELFGVTQLGSGPDEEDKLETLLRHPRIEGAFAFVRWATEFLGSEPDEQSLNTVRSRAVAIAP